MRHFKRIYRILEQHTSTMEGSVMRLSQRTIRITAVSCLLQFAAMTGPSVYGQTAGSKPKTSLRSPDNHSATPISLSGDITLKQLVELVSQRLGVSVQYESGRELDQHVTLRLRRALTDDELWRVLSATLEAQGMTIVETAQEGLYRVTSLAQAPTQNQRLLMPGQSLPADDGPGSTYASVIVQLQSIPSTELSSALAPIVPGANAVRPIGADGLVLITGVRRRVEEALQLVSLLDRPVDPAQRFIIALRHIAATDLAQLAEQILAAEQAIRGGGAQGRVTLPQMIALPGNDHLLVVASGSQRASLEALLHDLDVVPEIDTRSYASPKVNAKDLAEAITHLIGMGQLPGGGPASSSVFVDRATGAVLVTANVKEHARVASLVKQLSAAPLSARRVLKPIRVMNRPASELVDTISTLMELGRVEVVGDRSAGVAAASSANTDGDSPPPSPSPSLSASRTDLSLTVDEATNTIIASGAASSIEQLESLIAMLDERQPQVMIEVSLVTLSEGEALDVGVELRSQFSVGSTSVDLSSLFGLGSGGTGGALGGGTGLTGMIVNPGNFDAILRAVESVNEGRTSSTPRMLVNNNATTTLRSVASQPFTSINASQTVATTSFGGNQDAGTTVTMTPQIAQGDHLILEYSVELSSFTGESTTTAGGGVIPPPSQENSIEGSVTIPDGYTVVLGGVENTTRGKSQSRVPLLGRLPLVGALFGTTSTSTTRDRFYIFIRATILRDPLFEDLRQLSGQDLAAAGVADGTPTLSPDWID